MSEKFIPIKVMPSAKLHSDGIKHWPVPAQLLPSAGNLSDRFNRSLHDLRISVTDRCNFRCTYCMPKEIFTKDYPYLSQNELLSFEEITRLAKIFVLHGVRKIRLTGGEPLLRKNIEDLIAMLADIRTPEGHALDLTLTTNGSLLRKKASALRAAGLKRLTVSLDALDDPIFKSMNDVDFPVGDVLDGIQAASNAGFDQIKINMVVKRGVNDHEIIPMVKYFKNTGHTLRFIEFMDVGDSNAWQAHDVMRTDDIITLLDAAGFPLVPLPAQQLGETAQRFQHQDGSAELGFISSVSHAFCRDCNRARLSTQGMLYTCLFASEGHDLREHLRSTANTVNADEIVANIIRGIWEDRGDRYSELRDIERRASHRKKIEMSYIGG
ncbi:GTP 3',8-cyclase MoaA [Undibacterium sp. LX40W]|uniref:GTP 3',8-cyclase n=2 Tax=Undibacterium nitidum TaxID=2762298 RepID=A0A923HMD2_9BURK|nr:GTP 3',8-cyclase MoaA [Undibacterium sp. LX40W]MBC3882280.1 GTP 3',8-cyclase MoaA [Undibacterium nitidum]MBC3892561.1 GTP 3',8-cyclase MoaA [Undibacterium sp. LX40W]